MGEQHLLDLARIDVGAAGDDEVLGAVLEVQIAVGVEGADVAGVQPAAAQGRGRGLVVAPIAGHHHVAAAEDFAGLARRQWPVLRVRNHHLDAGIRPAGRGEPLAPARMIAVGDVFLRQRRDGHRATRPGRRSAPAAGRNGRAPAARPRHTSARRPRSACGCCPRCNPRGQSTSRLIMVGAANMDARGQASNSANISSGSKPPDSGTT